MKRRNQQDVVSTIGERLIYLLTKVLCERRKVMNKKLFNVFITLSMTSALFFGFAETANAEDDIGVKVGDAIVVSAEVLAIDKADRILTLLGPTGNVVELEVSEDAKNFNQVKVGDLLSVKYYESVAIYLGVPGTQPEADAGLVVARADEGEKPGVYAVGAVDVSASIVGINKKERTLTLKLPDGNEITTDVDESVKAFDTLKVGDSVHARLTKAFAITVEKP